MSRCDKSLSTTEIVLNYYKPTRMRQLTMIKHKLNQSIAVTLITVMAGSLAVPTAHASASRVITKTFTQSAARQTVSHSMKPIAVRNGFKSAAVKPKTIEPMTRTFNVKGHGGWPKNDGFVTKVRGTLQPGAKLSRNGYDSGRFVSPKGATFSRRSLPRGSERMSTTNYEVVKPISNWQGRAAPAFSMKGGAMQHQLPLSVKELVKSGHLRVIKKVQPKPALKPALAF